MIKNEYIKPSIEVVRLQNICQTPVVSMDAYNMNTSLQGVEEESEENEVDEGF